MLLLENANIWDMLDEGAIGIPTNGFIKRNGDGVMGAGLAKEAMSRFPGISYELGSHLKKNGNTVGWLLTQPQILAIPVKPVSIKINTQSDFKYILSRVKNNYSIGSTVPGFHCKASISLIKQSLIQLIDFIGKYCLNKVYIPLLGCGNGGLSYSKDLFPLLSKLEIPDSITLVTPV